MRAAYKTTFEFTLEDGDLVNDLGQRLGPVLQDGLTEARRVASDNSHWELELQRREIEWEEYQEILALTFRGEGAMVSFWPIPDALVNGSAELPGYQKDRRTMKRRVVVAKGNGRVAIRYGSLDGSDYQATQAMYAAFGEDLPVGISSEEIAKRRIYIPVEVTSIDELDEVARQAYDGYLTERYGGEWYGGRPEPGGGLWEFVSAQHDLINEHMKRVDEVFRRTSDPKERNILLEPHRYNFAAAQTRRRNGQTVESVAAAGDDARSNGETYDPYCPTDTAVTEQLEKLGLTKALYCPYCTVDLPRGFDICAPIVVCPNNECGATMVDGRTVYKGKFYEEAEAASKVKKQTMPSGFLGFIIGAKTQKWRPLFTVSQASTGQGKK